MRMQPMHFIFPFLLTLLLTPLPLTSASPTPPLTFLHLSDVHLNPHYDPTYTASSNCMDPAIHLASSSYNKKQTAPGVSLTSNQMTIVDCDTSPWLLNTTLASLPSSLSFVVLTGDLSAHGYVSSSYALSAISSATDSIRAYLPSTPVVPTIGNDDCYPDYSLPFSPNAEWLGKLAAIWDPWLSHWGQPAVASFLYGGFFEARVNPTLAILSLNTIYYSISHVPKPPVLPADPLGQLEWLESRLQAARQDGSYHVYIMGHIPPAVSQYQGSAMWEQLYATAYAELVGQYGDVLAGQFFGHTHRDEFRVIYRNNTNATPARIGGSLSLIFTNNPSYRIVEVGDAPHSWVPTDSVTYNMATDQGQVSYHKEYVWSSAYGDWVHAAVKAAKGPSLAGFLALYGTFPVNMTLLDAYSSRRMSGFPQLPVDPYKVLCAIACFDQDMFSSCVSSKVLPVPKRLPPSPPSPPSPSPSPSPTHVALKGGSKAPLAVVIGIIAGMAVLTLAALGLAISQSIRNRRERLYNSVASDSTTGSINDVPPEHGLPGPGSISSPRDHWQPRSGGGSLY